MATISSEEDLVVQSNEAAKVLATALKQLNDKTRLNAECWGEVKEKRKSNQAEKRSKTLNLK